MPRKTARASGGTARMTSREQRQGPDTDPLVAEHDDRACVQVFGHLLKVGLNDGRLIDGAAPGQAPDQQDRRARRAGPGQQAAEVCVSRYEYPRSDAAWARTT